MIDLFQARAESIAWAKDLLSRPADQWMILDTETTGLDSRAQVVQIGAIDGAGNVLIDNQLIKPTVQIEFEAYMVHGITPEHVENKPSFREYYGTLYELLKSRLCIIYNADFDTRILRQSYIASNIDESLYSEIFFSRAKCAMLEYARFVGEWNRYHQSFKWQRLPGGDHTALGDCWAVLALIKRMAESE